MSRGAMNEAQSLFGTVAAMVDRHEVNGDSVLREVALDLFQSIGTPVALSCAILLRYGELEQLVSKTISPASYNDLDLFESDYQVVNLLRKTPFVIEGLDRRANAKTKFIEAEAKCRETNARIRTFLSNPEKADSLIRQVFCQASSKIEEVLGTCVSYSDWISSCRFGPGVFNHPSARGISSAYDKLQVRPSATAEFRPAAAKLVMSSPCWSRSVTDNETEGFWPFVEESDILPVPGNRVTFVPKTATVDRAIAIEPLLNVYAQLGLGRMIRGLLLHCAQIDLNDQTVNQQLAQEGSLRGFLGTVDLSSASDTVAKEVVRALFPEAWFEAMDACRSKVGNLDGQWFRYEKFSSMGNGFTFELETLLFWALSVSTCIVIGCPPMVSVYGDDIVVPVQAEREVRDVLEYFGFSLNLKKTYFQGVFRESCGKDYYEGVDVRPFFQEEVPKKVSDLFLLANGLRRRAQRAHRYPFGCDVRYREAWRRVLRSVPKPVAKTCRVPAHAGDSEGFVMDWDEAQTSPFICASRRGWEGWYGIGNRPFPVHSGASNFEGGVAALLYRARDGFGDNFFPSHPRVGRDVAFKLREGVFYGPWTDLGPWVTRG